MPYILVSLFFFVDKRTIVLLVSSNPATILAADTKDTRQVYFYSAQGFVKYADLSFLKQRWQQRCILCVHRCPKLLIFQSHRSKNKFKY